MRALPFFVRLRAATTQKRLVDGARGANCDDADRDEDEPERRHRSAARITCDRGDAARCPHEERKHGCQRGGANTGKPEATQRQQAMALTITEERVCPDPAE